MGSLLKRRGIDRTTAKEACQEVAERMLTRQAIFESAEHFHHWLNKVAHNFVSNLQRKDTRLTTEDVPERSSPSVDVLVEPRLALETTVAAFAELSEADRRALTTALRLEPRGETKRERDRVSLQVLRARKRLRDLVDGRLAGLPWWRWRWPTDAVLCSVASQVAIGAIAVTVGVLSGWVVPHQAAEHPIIERISAHAPADRQPTTDDPGATPSATTATEPLRSPVRTTVHDEGERTPPEPEPWKHRVVVVPPGDAPGTTEIETNPRHPKDDSLFCWENVPHVDDACIAHPLRRDGEWTVPRP